MAKESSFDIVSDYDLQELRNALDQCQKEILNRYDFRGETTEIKLAEDKIHLVAAGDYKLQAIHSSLFQKAINRGLSPKIFKINPSQPTSGGNLKQELDLVKGLDAENAKKICKLLREHFPKVKSRIEAETVRVSSAQKDELQEVIAFLKSQSDFPLPLQFTNYR